ncbi:MAG: hypothetical protein BKP49_09185 [Treponema sp. CETP13]|nr:MAG: hypothetical protein BKP49_09185 [Treponema sp. CETP13]
MITHFFKRHISQFHKILITVIVVCLFLSIFLYIKEGPGKRFVFVFESMDYDSLYTEERWMQTDSPLTKDDFVIKELLLGPETYRYKALFKNGTKSLFNYREGNSIYVNLSEDASMQDESTSNTQKACELMRLNIKHLVRGIKNVTIFIAGNEICGKDFVKANDLAK